MTSPGFWVGQARDSSEVVVLPDMRDLHAPINPVPQTYAANEAVALFLAALDPLLTDCIEESDYLDVLIRLEQLGGMSYRALFTLYEILTPLRTTS